MYKPINKKLLALLLSLSLIISNTAFANVLNKDLEYDGIHEAQTVDEFKQFEEVSKHESKRSTKVTDFTLYNGSLEDDGGLQGFDYSNIQLGSPIGGKIIINSEATQSEESQSEISPMSSSLSSSNFESLIQPSFINRVNHPHLSGRSTTEYVSPFDGTLQLNVNDISLPGRNGLDLNINHFYKSEASNVEASYASDNILRVNSTTYYNERFALGLGWSFGFPSVQRTINSNGTVQTFYHDGTGAAYRSNYLDTTRDDNGNALLNNGHWLYNSNLDNYYVDNVKFLEKDHSYSRNNYLSQYSFKTADNTKQYFGKSGELLAIKDRFGNEIAFDYINMPGRNLIPFDSYKRASDPSKQFTCDVGWSTRGPTLRYDSTSSTSNSATSYSVELDDVCDEYYVSLVYEAIDEDLTMFSGAFEVYCDLYDGINLKKSVLISTVTPTVYNSTIMVDGSFSLKSFNLYQKVNYAVIRIKMKNAKNLIKFDDIRLSPKTPLISKITDTIGRTVVFDYQGDIYTRYANPTDFPLIVTVNDVNGDLIRTITYDRRVYTYILGTDEDTYEEHRYFFFSGSDNEDIDSWVDYDWKDGWGSNYYANQDIYNSYNYFGRPLVKKIVNRNSKTYFEYEKVTKWTDNRPLRSTAPATINNTGYIETWRVVKKYDVNDSVNGTNPMINTTMYNYTAGYYTDETGYNKRGSSGMEPGFLDPYGGGYKVTVTSPTGSQQIYEYTSHTFNTGYRRNFPIELPLLDKTTVKESSSNLDVTVAENTYTDNFAVTSPTKVKMTETVN